MNDQEISTPPEIELEEQSSSMTGNSGTSGATESSRTRVRSVPTTRC